MHVFLATPAYDGRVIPQFEESLKSSLRVLRDAGVTAHWQPLTGCCYLPVARNYLAKMFLESKASDLVFIDADIEWTPDDLLRLLSWPVEIVGGAYRHKTWEETYPIWLKTDPEGRPVMGGISELISCWGVPTGFMRISRSVFTDIQAKYGESLEVCEYTPEAELRETYLNFFDTEKIGKQWWGEDCNFCRRWAIEMNRPLWVDPHINVVHWGRSPLGADQPFIGNYHEYLSRLPGGANDPGYHGNKIDGFMSLRELQWLYNRARGMGSVVEVGCFKGRSTHALLSACPGLVYCVDPWSTEYSFVDASNRGINPSEHYEAFISNTADFPNRAVIRKSSIEAAKDFADKSVDMAFIDGDHSAEAVRADIAAWLPKVRKLICGHDYDYYGWPEVKRTVDDIFESTVQSDQSIWWVEV